MTVLRAPGLITGYMILALAVAMLAPALANIADPEADAAPFVVGAVMTGFLGGALAFGLSGPTPELSPRAAVVLTTLSWAVLTVLAAIPFRLAGMAATDAVFEAMSGLTTTGATVITNLEAQSRGLLLWRAILQWIGGVGIIVTAMAILPMLRVGGMQLFRLESSDASEKILPRATEIAGSIALIYLILTVVCVLAYALAGMSGFDAVAHAMTTIATGGFSTSDRSMGAFVDGGADIVACVFMLAGGLPFGLYLIALRGGADRLWRDAQSRGFLIVAVSLLSVLAVYLWVSGRTEGAGDAVRLAAFNVISILTGTGYASAAYDQWGAFAVGFFFCLMFVGGCAGSTACGIKIFRFQVAGIAMFGFLAKMARPHVVTRPKYNGKTLSESVVGSVLSFFFIFFACYTVLAIGLSALGLDLITALSGAGTALANVGPGLGPIIGPAGTFAPLPDAAKWLLCLGMLAGRLEVLAFLVLFAPSFWRN
ncbi:MAG: TrkH family potassium uptake protein [Maricaulaceae bacterium]